MGLFSFSQWRALLQQTARIASYVIVVQQKSYEQLQDIHRRDPAWQFLEYGEPLVLRPLGPEDIPSLIERPVRNYFRFAPDALGAICRLTGGSPFLIQAFCYSLVNHLAEGSADDVTLAAVEAVRQEFMRPEENLFTHLLDLAPGQDEQVLACAARLAASAEGTFCLADLRASLQAALPAGQKDRPGDFPAQALARLVANDVLQPAETDGQYRFGSLLFAQWLAQNGYA